MRQMMAKFKKSCGAILTFEAAILLLIGGVSAIALGVILAGHLPDIVLAWLNKLAASVNTVSTTPT